MSARFSKILMGVFLAHALVLSLIWVGFSTPLPRPPVTFIYDGPLPAQDTDTEQLWQKNKALGQVVLNNLKATHFNRWHTLRDAVKPMSNL